MITDTDSPVCPPRVFYPDDGFSRFLAYCVAEHLRRVASTGCLHIDAIMVSIHFGTCADGVQFHASASVPDFLSLCVCTLAFYYEICILSVLLNIPVKAYCYLPSICKTVHLDI
ncbi:uncharacterized protein BT62DRAFT_574933 [Guyanagaster necrorhizus]|uniref:Uncharacterized protein n=1 Tax=Guyanagaster necrorhizus TaxID=856835 RepID=A0A9P7VHH5_9AGAR|nr:uncharacterized protein BT62DRAFT_574933 [Guyanagaster necrorhizus MCA 3950]KAG7440652.1 hypothetical protein BT62DRAFT_574933 [Guyanagaster necrorhizus MCA 3950]